MSKTNKFLLILCFFFLVLKITSIYVTNLDLFGDEAQYWLWSKNLDFGYYSKPPLLPWVIAMICSVFGNSIFVIKMIPVFLYCISSYVVFLISKKLSDVTELALLTAVTFFLMPAVSVSSFLVSTDILLVLFWCLALLQILIIKEKPSILNFVLMGIFVGLAFLAKYAAIYFIFSMLLLLFEKDMKDVFIKNKLLFFYFFMTVGVIIAPNIFWNINNDWSTFKHISDNAGLSRADFHFFESLRFFGSQIIMVGPLIFLFFVFVFVKYSINDFSTRFLLIFSLPVFIIILGESILVRANANWAAISLVSFLILFVHTIFKFNKKLILLNNFVNLAIGVGLFFLIGISLSSGPFKRIAGIGSFADLLVNHHNLEQTNRLVVSDRMLFSNLGYIFYFSEVELYVPHNSDTKLDHHFQISHSLPTDFNNNFLFIGHIDHLNYLINKPTINLIDYKIVKFNKEPIKIYEVVF